MFFSLGLKNAWRNRGRTALGMVSMAVAAIIFLSSSTLSRGYPALAFLGTRRLLGGDILLIPGKNVLTREDLATGEYTWMYHRRSLDEPNLAMGFDTSPYSYGSIQGFGASGPVRVSLDRYREVLTELSADPSVSHAYIRREIPFLVLGPPPTSGSQEYSFIYGFLDARDVAHDLEAWSLDTVTTGAYLGPGDDGMTGVAVVGWQGQSLSLMTVGLQIPRYTGHADRLGVPVLDYEDCVRVSITLKGLASFTEGSGVATRTAAAPALFVTPSTFSRLANQAGYPEEATCWGISVTVESMAELDNVASLLRRKFPDFTVLPASLLEAVQTSGTPLSSAVPMDMRRVTEAMAFVTAALLSATNLTILMQSRKNEIGILRALGATGWNIASMILTESVWIALLGAFIGSLVTQPAILWQFLSNRATGGAVMDEVSRGIGKTIGFSTAAAVVFGFLPVARALRVTPAEVLRGE